MPNIASVLDRLEDRLIEIVKAWNSVPNLESLEFDLDLVDKDIEQVRNLIREEEKRTK